MSYTVTFQNVGRSKATFSTTMEKINGPSLLRAVRPHLMSSDIDFTADEEERVGLVVVGGFRTVGEFMWEETP
jgi:hypothetical protein